MDQAIRSVQHQTYACIQLIVVDDHSTDSSRDVIQNQVANDPSIEFIPLPTNLGNCRAFNNGLIKVRGEFVIDLSADDILLPTRIERGVEELQTHGINYGVNFSDAELTSETNELLGLHSEKFSHEAIPQGDVFADVLSRYFISSATMMMRKEVFDKLGGYDETLAYEDFDFWVRSSRYFQYCYTPDPLVRKRIVENSLGRRQYLRGSVQMNSTLVVCEKALALCKNQAEFAALKKRVQFEVRQAIKTGNWGLWLGYWKLWRKIPSR